MNTTRVEVLKLVDNERNRQDAKWGEQNHEPSKWVAILGEEFGEYCQAVNETVFDNGPSERIKGGSENMIKELTHVAAVAVGAIECIMRAEAKAAGFNTRIAERMVRDIAPKNCPKGRTERHCDLLCNSCPTKVECWPVAT